MKKLIFILTLALLPLAGFGQAVFDKYAESEDVSVVIMQPKMFQLLAKMSVNAEDPEAQEFFSLVNSITSFKVMTTDNANVSADIAKWVDKHLKSSAMEELMRVRDEDTNVKFYVKEGKDADHVEELLMLVTGADRPGMEVNGKKIETVILSLTGSIDLTQISKLTSKMDLPGGDQLGKAEQKKSNK